MDFKYNIIRSGRRTLALELRRDMTVLVRAPYRLSVSEIDRFVSSKSGWLEAHIEKQRLIAQKRPEPSEGERQELICRAKAELPERAAYFSGIMRVEPAGISVTGAKTRFGSCSSKNRLCFSWRLMRYPQEAVDYVVVHELAHILHKNHGKGFYSVVSAVLPDYKERRKLLRE